MRHLDKILAYGLCLVAFLLPWQTRYIFRAGELNGGYSEYLTISLYGLDILMAAVLLAYFFSLSKYSKKATDSVGLNARLLAILGVFDLSVFVSVFFALDIRLAIFRYLIFLLAIGLAYLVAFSDYRYDHLVMAMFSGAAIVSGLAIWQFLSQVDFQNKWLGKAVHHAGDLGASVVETADGGRWLRAYGSLDHPNILGGYLTLVLLVFLSYVFSQSGDSKSKYIRGVYLFLSPIVFFGLLVSFSRAAWIAFAVGLAVFLFISWRAKKIRSSHSFVGALLAGIAITLVFCLNFWPLIRPRLDASARIETISLSERSAGLREGLALVKANLFPGIGLGNYVGAMARSEPALPAWSYQPVHNVFILVGAEIGLIGGLSFLGLLALLFYETIRKKDAASAAILATLIVLLFFDHWLWSLHFGLITFGLMAGLVIARRK